jgi:hypothetical protein
MLVRTPSIVVALVSPLRTAVLERIPALLSSDDYGSRVERAAQVKCYGEFA